MTLEQGQQLLGKRVLVKTKTGEVGGIMEFLGYNNRFPSWGLQITIGRMPIQNISLSDIQVLDESTGKWMDPTF
jgi:hypothetical protein